MELSLRDDLFLLAHDDTGRLVIHEASLDAGLAGATLIDLLLARRVGVRDGRLVVLDPDAGDDDPIADQTVAAIEADTAASLRPGEAAVATGPRAWVAWLGEGMCARVTARLAAAGVVERTTARTLGLLPVARTLPTPPEVAVRVRARLRYAVSDAQRLDPRTAALCGLVRATRLESTLYLGLPTGELLGRLDGIAARQEAAVRLVVGAVAAVVAAHSAATYG